MGDAMSETEHLKPSSGRGSPAPQVSPPHPQAQAQAHSLPRQQFSSTPPRGDQSPGAPRSAPRSQDRSPRGPRDQADAAQPSSPDVPGGGMPVFSHGAYLSDLRHDAEEASAAGRASSADLIVSKWRMKDRMKTGCVAIVLCLNIGVDPPDVIKISPCARMECWIDPLSMQAQKALDTIGKSLQAQYERWQPRARYKLQLDPTVEEVKKLCTSCRRSAKGERVLFHYNGHGVPKPTLNGEIWLFNKTYTQYIPLSVYELESWLATPSIYVFDCSAAGMIVSAFTDRPEWGPSTDAAGSVHHGGSSSSMRDCILLAACGGDETLPQSSEMPADVFTSCLTTPIKIALRWFCPRSLLALDPDNIDKIPGRQNDRKTPLGELNWIFTAITDTIAWNVLPRDLFQRLFRQDLLVASIFRNFLLAERIMRAANCTPLSYPRLPPTHQHPMWQAWDMAAEICLAQLPDLLADPHAEFQPSPFFTEQLTAFEVWLEHGSEHKKPPEQLPIVLQVLLSQSHRLRALVLLGRFLDMGPWAVDLALSVGIFPYVLKLLQTTATELRQILVFIWTKILAVDKSCQVDLVKDGGHVYFIKFLDSAEGVYAEQRDRAMAAFQRAMAAFVLAVICEQHPKGQAACIQAGLVGVCLSHIRLAPPSEPLLLQWLCLCLGKLWHGASDAQLIALKEDAPQILAQLLAEPQPEVRASATYALGTLIHVGPVTNSAAPEQPEGPAEEDFRISSDREIGRRLLSVLNDGSSLVRTELAVALARLGASHNKPFRRAAAAYLRPVSSASTPVDSPVAQKLSQPLAFSPQLSLMSGGSLRAQDGTLGIRVGSGGRSPSIGSLRAPTGLVARSLESRSAGGGTSMGGSLSAFIAEEEASNLDEHEEKGNKGKGRGDKSGSALDRLEESSRGGRAASARLESTQYQAQDWAAGGATSSNSSNANTSKVAQSNGVSMNGVPSKSANNSWTRGAPNGGGNNNGSGSGSSRSTYDASCSSIYMQCILAIYTLARDPSPRVASLARQALRGVGVEPVFSAPARGHEGDSKASARADPKPLPLPLPLLVPSSYAAPPMSSITRSTSWGGSSPGILPAAWRGSPTPASPLAGASAAAVPPAAQGPPSPSPSTMMRRALSSRDFSSPSAVAAHLQTSSQMQQRGGLQAVNEAGLAHSLSSPQGLGEVAGVRGRGVPVNGSHEPVARFMPAAAGTSSATLPESTLYRWSCGHFSRPLLEPQVDEEAEAKRAEREKRALAGIVACQRTRVTAVSDQIARCDTESDRSTQAVALHPFLPLVCIADEKETIRIWDYKEGRVVNTFENQVYGAASPDTGIAKLTLLNELDDSLLLVASCDGRVRVWRNFSSPGRQRLASAWQAVQGHRPGARGNAAVVDWQQLMGYLYASGDLSSILVWDLARELLAHNVATQCEAAVTSLASSHVLPGRLLAGCGDGTVRIFDMRTRGSLIHTLRTHSQKVVGCDFQPGSDHTKVVTASVAGDIRFTDLRMGLQPYQGVDAHRGSLSTLAVHRHAGVMASGSAKQYIKVFNMSGDQLSMVRYHNSFLGQRIGPVTSLHFHPYSVLLAAGASDSVVSIYSGEEGAPLPPRVIPARSAGSSSSSSTSSLL
eukprot:TRINITY_DN22146_c0_g1_i1.p1 TRINITY_DN22146_c0_g1~~TRINITY_DN22146_c0_g1_i1.p1  ORF type:complete len:1612 (-),score=347.58 TRINITY_DN22146_c0_g1_i1:1787-6622(-)